MRIGPYLLENNLGLAPMAGVTDRPFRQLCKRLGAGMAASEMVASNPALRGTRKTRLKADHCGEAAPRIVQIAGADPATMAEAARHNAAQGAQIIDINMGCPAKKVCNKLAGSALLADEGLVREILEATVAAVDVPVTLKTRTGTGPDNRNALRVARMAESAGIAALALHGRTRADAYRGQAEYETIRRVKQAIGIPVLANGDIDSPEKAEQVLAYTGADGLLIGRAAQGRPWIFREIGHYLRTGERLAPPSDEEVADILTGHLTALYAFYGEYQGVRIARKHVGWYLRGRPDGEPLRRAIMRIEDAGEQLHALRAALLPGRDHVSASREPAPPAAAALSP
ncbi:tRNA dihydrouridine synthase DusB [Ectothiorhodospiraceae bacterium WFHF3C12]|nr:tRNA dihydrouridine synthase DusB [Ectothiorhodospiraceae bacterium WFHF3C12]